MEAEMIKTAAAWGAAYRAWTVARGQEAAALAPPEPPTVPVPGAHRTGQSTEVLEEDLWALSSGGDTLTLIGAVGQSVTVIDHPAGRLIVGPGGRAVAPAGRWALRIVE